MLRNSTKELFSGSSLKDLFGGEFALSQARALPGIPTANLVAWYDMSDTGSITSSGGAVSAVADKSGNGNNLAQATAGNKPTTGTRKINGLNVLDFDGGDFMDSSCPMSDRTATSFILASCDVFTATSASGQMKLFGTSASGGEAMRINIDTPGVTRTLCIDSDNVALLFNSNLSPGTGGEAGIRPFIAAAILTATTIEIRLDGSSNSGANSTTFTAGRTLRLCAGSGGAEFFNGVVGEFLQYSATLTAGEVAAVMDYLQKKWGLVPVSS